MRFKAKCDDLTKLYQWPNCKVKLANSLLEGVALQPSKPTYKLLGGIPLYCGQWIKGCMVHKLKI